MNKSAQVWILVFLILCGAFLRLYHLTENPAGLFPDEASTGYDAWALIHYGIDQHAKPWPLFFRSFADDLIGTYRYLVLLFQLFLGPSVLSIRLPAALAGCATLLITYRCARVFLTENAALSVLFLLSFSPWHIPYCRTGQRIMLFPLALSAFYYFQLKSNRNSSMKYSVAKWACLGLALYTYVAARLIVPLLALFTLITELTSTKRSIRKTVAGLLVFVIVVSPFLIHAVRNPDQLRMRFQQVSIFSQHLSPSALLSRFTHQYFSHFSLNFLFVNGDQNLRHSQWHIGELFWVQLPLLIIGLIFILLNPDKNRIFLLFWILISPLPAALSIDGNPHALRSVGALLPLIFICGIAAEQLFRLAQQHSSAAKIFLVSLFFLAAFEAFWTSYDLFYRYPVYSAKAWEFGTREAIAECRAHYDDYDSFWFTPRAIGADRIIAFEEKIPPEQFARNGLMKTKFRWIWNMDIRQVINSASEARRLFILRNPYNGLNCNCFTPILYPDHTPAFVFCSNR